MARIEMTWDDDPLEVTVTVEHPVAEVAVKKMTDQLRYLAETIENRRVWAEMATPGYVWDDHDISSDGTEIHVQHHAKRRDVEGVLNPDGTVRYFGQSRSENEGTAS